MPGLKVALRQYREAIKLNAALACYELDGLEQPSLSDFFKSLQSCGCATPTKVRIMVRTAEATMAVPCFVTSLRSVQVPDESGDDQVADYMDVCDWIGEGYIPLFGDDARAKAVSQVWFHLEMNNQSDLGEVTDGLLQFINHKSLNY
jgi:hypothetical protein